MAAPKKPKTEKTAAPRTDGTGLIDLDPWLEPFGEDLRRRYQKFQDVRSRLTRAFGSLEVASRGHEFFGFNRGAGNDRPGTWYREWAPQAFALSLIGDFNNWDPKTNRMEVDQYGVWSTFLPDDEYAGRLTHGSHVKVHVVSEIGPKDRIPAYIRRVVQDPATHLFCGQYWMPPEPFAWQHPVPPIRGGLKIYESHVGMGTEQEKVSTYTEFAETVLPRAAGNGYNAIQLMAIQEHPYYASFGYHVSNFFAASSRFGTPEELKALIDAAHGQGLVVLLDLIHSHSVKNVDDGLNRFDGTEQHYFHTGERREHRIWDSLLFDYGQTEVLRFLLSNVRYWLEEYRFDGFRFDGITSMMYHHHGLSKAFTSYDDYFGAEVEDDGVAYLQLANDVAHSVRHNVVTIAEDASGMPGLARPVEEGGLGFDYRLAMGLPDFWFKTVQEKKDEDWSVGHIFHELTNRRQGEKHIAYVESHDQALVGSKTLAFELMDADMYWHMTKLSQHLVIDRGIALHKMIRLVTFALGGAGYLNFMGNEFGHPEWIDFPRQGNQNSYKHARRQWSLVDADHLRYSELNRFDRAMLALDDQFSLLTEPAIEQINVDEGQQVLAIRRAELIFVFNFHPLSSFAGYRIGTSEPADYAVILNTDAEEFGGHGIMRGDQLYPHQKKPSHGRPQSIETYLPARTAQVLAPRGLAGSSQP